MTPADELDPLVVVEEPASELEPVIVNEGLLPPPEAKDCRSRSLPPKHKPSKLPVLLQARAAKSRPKPAPPVEAQLQPEARAAAYRRRRPGCGKPPMLPPKLTCRRNRSHCC